MVNEHPYAPRTYGSLQRVTERVYIFRNIVNSAVILGDEAIAVIDTQVNAALAQRPACSTSGPSRDKPIRYAINTHYHWDHTGGNYVFKDVGATVLSSVRTREFIQVRTPRQKAFLLSRALLLARIHIWRTKRSRASGDRPGQSTAVSAAPGPRRNGRCHGHSSASGRLRGGGRYGDDWQLSRSLGSR